MNGLSLLDHISIIHDQRQSWKISYSLTDILFLTVTAVIGGAEGWEEIEDFGEDHLDWLRLYGNHRRLAEQVESGGYYTGIDLVRRAPGRRLLCPDDGGAGFGGGDAAGRGAVLCGRRRVSDPVPVRN